MPMRISPKGFFLLIPLFLVIFFTLSQKAFASWLLDFETVPPSFTSSSLPLCVTQASIPFPLKISASDNDSGSGVVNVYWELKRQSDGVTVKSGNIIQPETPPYPNIWSPSNWNIAAFPPPPLPVGKYDLYAQVTDAAGNKSSLVLLDTFDLQNTCQNPWIKTTGGDVHTNESINVPQ